MTPLAVDHVRCDCGRDRVVDGHGLGHGAHEVVERHVDELGALDVVIGGRVEGDVDAAACGGDSIRVLLDRGAVEYVELGDVAGAAIISDVVGDLVEGRLGAAGEMDFGALAGVCARDCGAIAPAAP